MMGGTTCKAGGTEPLTALGDSGDGGDALLLHSKARNGLLLLSLLFVPAEEEEDNDAVAAAGAEGIRNPARRCSSVGWGQGGTRTTFDWSSSIFFRRKKQNKKLQKTTAATRGFASNTQYPILA